MIEHICFSFRDSFLVTEAHLRGTSSFFQRSSVQVLRQSVFTEACAKLSSDRTFPSATVNGMKGSAERIHVKLFPVVLYNIQI